MAGKEGKGTIFNAGGGLQISVSGRKDEGGDIVLEKGE